jgi:hypothetical protein
MQPAGPVIRCACLCHQVHRGDQRPAASEGRGLDAFRHAQDAKRALGADVTDPLEAAIACDRCKNCHCPALIPRYSWGPRIMPRPQFTLLRPPPPATGCNGDGWEGD